MITLMIFSNLAVWWRRLLVKLGWHPRGTPVWGDGIPTIKGVCPCCGALILDGWHHEGPDGLTCLRCFNAKKQEETGKKERT